MQIVALALLAAIQAAPADAGRPNRARATPAGLVLELRSDFGFERVFDVEFSNGHRVTMNMNDGLGVSAGLSFLPLARGRFATRVSVGIKADRVRASNGSALFTAFPVDWMETAYVGPLRLGAGVSVLLAPRIRGDRAFEQAKMEFDPAPGAIVDVEWIVSARTRTGIGARASWYRFESSGRVWQAPAVGLVIRADFDVSGR